METLFVVILINELKSVLFTAEKKKKILQCQLLPSVLKIHIKLILLLFEPYKKVASKTNKLVWNH